jgi:hypothetical protein
MAKRLSWMPSRIWDWANDAAHALAVMPNPRRFPPPWSVEDIDAAFVVKDSSGQKLGSGATAQRHAGTSF